MNARTKAFLLCGAVACPVFMIVVMLEGATRPGYYWSLYPLSSLAMGEMGWMQILNFILTGILIFLFSIGLRTTFNPQKIKFRGPLLISLVGIGLIGAGIFVTDPVFGYPSTEPLLLRQFTWHGHLHDLFSMFVFVCLPWACFVFRKRFSAMGEQRWAAYSAFTGFAIIVAFVFTSMGFKQIPLFVNYSGIFQRLCITIGWTWITLLSLHLVRDKQKKASNKLS